MLTVGLLCTTLLMLILNDIFLWVWLPIVMGIAMTVVVRYQPWLRISGLGVLVSGTLLFGLTFTYCLSAQVPISRFGSRSPNAALIVEGSLFALSFLPFLGVGLTSRKTAPVTAWMIVPILAVCVVGYVSGGIGGADHMQKWLISVFQLPQDQAETIIHWLRKTIHFVAYGSVGYCLFRSAIAGRSSKKRAILFSLLMVLCLASFDELRQTTAPNRTGSAWDVTLDMTGATVFAFLGAATVANAPRKPSVA